MRTQNGEGNWNSCELRITSPFSYFFLLVGCEISLQWNANHPLDWNKTLWALITNLLFVRAEKKTWCSRRWMSRSISIITNGSPRHKGERNSQDTTQHHQTKSGFNALLHANLHTPSSREYENHHVRPKSVVTITSLIRNRADISNQSLAEPLQSILNPTCQSR